MKLFDRPILSYFVILIFTLLTFSLFSAGCTLLGLEGVAADLYSIAHLIPAALCASFVVCKVFFKGAFSGPFSTEGIAEGIKMFAIVIVVDVIFFIFDRIMGNGTTLNDVLHVVAISCGAGIMEEMVFRALTLPNLMRLKRDYRGMIFSVLLTSAVFGFVHLINMTAGGDVLHSLQQSVTAGISGVLFAAVYLHTGTIIPCMLFHIFHDVLNMLFMGITQNGAMTEGVTLASLIPQIIYSATELGVAIRYLRSVNFDKIRAIWDEKWGQ